jgi:hypothetical protein
MEQRPIVPPRTADETHEQYMNSFINLLVNTTKHANEFTKLDDDAQKLFGRIINACRETMLKAARTRHSSAVIFMYCINRHNGIYDLLFPTGHIAAQMEKHNIVPVFQKLQQHMNPLELEHKIYEVFDGDVVEIINHTGQLILPDEVEEDEEVYLQEQLNEGSSFNESSSEETSLPDICTETEVSEVSEVQKPEPEPVEGVKKLKPVRRHVGVITVSWEKQVNSE